MRCLTGQGQCSVAHTMRRKCTKCRLERCFNVGMRKDFFLSEEEKQQRRKRLEEKRNASSRGIPTSESNRLSNLESISQEFDEIDRVSIDAIRNFLLFPRL
jgi:nuclear receptor subfamily 1 group I